MKTPFFCTFAIALMLITAAGNSAAQDITGGVVKYKQTTKYNFETIYAERARGDANVQQWLASLPKENQQFKVLYFTEKTALYEKDPTVKEEAPDPGVQRALMGASRVRGGGARPALSWRKCFMISKKMRKFSR